MKWAAEWCKLCLNKVTACLYRSRCTSWVSNCKGEMMRHIREHQFHCSKCTICLLEVTEGDSEKTKVSRCEMMTAQHALNPSNGQGNVNKECFNSKCWNVWWVICTVQMGRIMLDMVMRMCWGRKLGMYKTCTETQRVLYCMFVCLLHGSAATRTIRDHQE